MPTVRIPPVLRTQAGGQKQVQTPGSTVGEVIQALTSAHPGLREQLLTADGTLNRFVNVFVNGSDVRYLQELETPMAESDTLILLPAMAGGSQVLRAQQPPQPDCGGN